MGDNELEFIDEEELDELFMTIEDYYYVIGMLPCGCCACCGCDIDCDGIPLWERDDM